MIRLFGLTLRSITSLFTLAALSRRLVPSAVLTFDGSAMSIPLALDTIRNIVIKTSVPRDGGLKVSPITQVDICVDDRSLASGGIKSVKAA